MALAVKIIIIGCLLFMVFSLFQALFVLNKSDPNKPSMSKFIGRRVMISAFIIILVLVAVLTGVITPNQRPF